MAKKPEAPENTTTSTELVKIQNEEDLEIALARLNSLAASATGPIKDKLDGLAQLTSPDVKGIEGEQRMTIPSIFLRQKISSSPIMPPTVKVGGMFDSNGEALPDEIEFIPILGHQMRQKWTEDNRIDCQSLDGTNGSQYGKCESCPYGRYEEGKKTECSSGSRFYTVTADLTAIYRINFLKSSAGAGKNIYRLTTPPALWARTFVLSTEKKNSGGRDFHAFVVRPSGNKTPKDVMEVCDALYGVFHASYEKMRQTPAKPAAAGTSADISVRVVGEESDTIDFSDNV